MIKLDFSGVDPLARFKRGTASNYILSLSEMVQGDRVVICCRVSGRVQKWKRSLDKQERNLRQIVKKRGGIVVGVVSYQGSGIDPSWLLEAARLARKHRAILLAESTDRFIRHPSFNTDYWPTAQAREADLWNLESWSPGVLLMTVLDPDAKPSLVRNYQQDRGKRMTKTPGYKKQETIEATPEIIRLKKAGLTQHEIARRVGMNQPRVRRVILKWKAGCQNR